VTEPGYRTIETATNLDIHDNLLWRWLKADLRMARRIRQQSKLQIELKQLKRANERLRMEPKKLKKRQSSQKARTSLISPENLYKIKFIKLVKKALVKNYNGCRIRMLVYYPPDVVYENSNFDGLVKSRNISFW
jgi:regulator of replication initiation timing